MLRIWNPEKPQVKNSTELRGHTGAIERVAWNPTKEAELASVSTDGTVRFWDVRNKICIETVQLGARGLSLAWSEDGKLVIACRGERAVFSSPDFPFWMRRCEDTEGRESLKLTQM